MARKNNKGSPAKNADSPPVPRSQKPRAPRSQAQGPQPKPAAAKTSTKKTEQRPEAKPKATGIPSPNRSSSAPKTGLTSVPQTPGTERPAVLPWVLNPKYSSAVEAGDTSHSILVQLLGITELGGMIIELLVPSIGDLTALAMTCKRARACMRRYFDVWDFRLREFSTDAYREKRDDNNRLLQQGGVRINTLVISPVSDEPEGLQNPCMADFKSMMKLCGAITEIPSTFRSLVLDQVPFFDVKMFELMIKTMPTLETVTITRCIMLDITKLPQLLAAIKRHPRLMKTRRTRPMFDNAWAKKLARAMRKTRITPEQEAQAQGVAARRTPAPTMPVPTMPNPKKDDEDYVCLDFFPFFFHGPSSGPRLGSYGVTHNEPTFNTPKAVFAVILQCWDLAQEVGMDLVSESSSFWRFVRQLPGPDALWAMKAREALLTREYEKVILPTRHQQMVQDRFADDLTAALTGDNQDHPKAPPLMRTYLPPDYVDRGKYWRLKAKCGICKFTYPVSLFPLQRDACWSCKMTRFVKYMEDSHGRLWQESALQKLQHGLDLRSTDLHKLLLHIRKQALKKAMCDVRVADWVREYFLNLPTRAGPNPNAPPSADNWDTAVPAEVLHCPPPPRGLDATRASMVRWRWNYAEATEAFDCRQGGPQWAHPCQTPLSAGHSDGDNSGGAETKEQFGKKWEWTRGSDELFITRYLKVNEAERQHQGSFGTPVAEIYNRDDERVLKALKNSRQRPDWRDYIMILEWCDQNKLDKEVHREQYGKVQDCLHSMSTPTRKPFNLDTPLPDPGVDKEAYDQLIKEAAMLPPYNHSRSSSHR
ncbi:hypothetical protein C8A01DRAFT_14696 [Parachaetomium inaequale]|uniref:Uncharacterized protein n=1 Tax=Parachaetomium inaequale TaxID=2588326 RepID=A0AAN6PN65_9PEZI|nr:hypothetical protein C8A01DRAFT_14696 [Parachaetomium inaequale]